MTSERMLPAMDIHHQNDNHEVQYRQAKTRYPTDTSIDQFELFTCVYDPGHKINSKTWRTHLRKCRLNYGGRLLICDFNATHHIPAPEKDWHMMTCPDKHAIVQDFTSARRMATQVNHNPQWQAPETSEDWGEEIAENPGEAFSLDHRKSMPIHLLPKRKVVEEEFEDEQEYEEEEDQEAQHSVLHQDLLPERPSNWESMSKAQKKNYKRKYNLQRQKMTNEGVTETDFQPVKDPKLWSEEQRNAKINAIKANYPLAPDKQHAERFDYASLLNIVCQKCQIHLPEWKECPGEQGGFGYTCRIGQNWYKGVEFCTTKKDAKHECARWALLGMEVPGVDNDKQVCGGQNKPVHPRLAEDLQKMREADEVGKLIAANMYQAPKKNTTPLRQPRTKNSPVSSPLKQEHPPQPQAQQQKQQQQYAQPPRPDRQQPKSWGNPTPASTNPPPGFAPNPVNSFNTQPPGFSRPAQTNSGGGWGQTSNSNSAPPVSGMQNMVLGNEDFPALGGGAAPNAWSTVPKKGNAKGVNKGAGRGRGRGRGTTMKL